jgi:hypothetical protein
MNAAGGDDENDNYEEYGDYSDENDPCDPESNLPCGECDTLLSDDDVQQCGARCTEGFRCFRAVVDPDSYDPNDTRPSATTLFCRQHLYELASMENLKDDECVASVFGPKGGYDIYSENTKILLSQPVGERVLSSYMKLQLYIQALGKCTKLRREIVNNFFSSPDLNHVRPRHNIALVELEKLYKELTEQSEEKAYEMFWSDRDEREQEEEKMHSSSSIKSTSSSTSSNSSNSSSRSRSNIKKKKKKKKPKKEDEQKEEDLSDLFASLISADDVDEKRKLESRGDNMLRIFAHAFPETTARNAIIKFIFHLAESYIGKTLTFDDFVKNVGRADIYRLVKEVVNQATEITQIFNKSIDFEVTKRVVDDAVEDGGNDVVKTVYISVYALLVSLPPKQQIRTVAAISDTCNRVTHSTNYDDVVKNILSSEVVTMLDEAWFFKMLVVVIFLNIDDDDDVVSVFDQFVDFLLVMMAENSAADAAARIQFASSSSSSLSSSSSSPVAAAVNKKKKKKQKKKKNKN